MSIIFYLYFVTVQLIGLTGFRYSLMAELLPYFIGKG